MTNDWSLKPDGNYFLVPVMPTPNGRMHLGHIAGPYLKMDVIKRKVQRMDGVAYMYSGVDVYESYMELKADQDSSDPKTLANHYFNQIVKDFEALDIRFNEFINPLDFNLNASFIEFQKNMLSELIEQGMVVEQTERMLYDPQANKWLVGCWLNGTCPNCLEPTGSYTCENCGMHYKPEDIFNEKDYPNAEVKLVKSLFLKLDETELLRFLNKNKSNKLKRLLESYLEQQGPFIRLTAPQKIGIAWDNDQVIFTYSALLFFSVFCGELAKKNGDVKSNPFNVDSDFTTIASFGTDTTIPYLCAVIGGGVAHQNYRALDYLLTNHFYDLNGEKFSTSRLNVIWGDTIVNHSKISSDIVRYYLCTVNPEHEKKNFDVAHFIDFVNTTLNGQFNDKVKAAFNRLSPGVNYQISSDYFDEIEAIIKDQNNCFSCPNFELSQGTSLIQQWVSRFDDKALIDPHQAYWWLKTLAFIAYPVMPVMGRELWKFTSGDIEVSLSNFLKTNTIEKTPEMLPQFTKVTMDELEKSLPKK